MEFDALQLFNFGETFIDTIKMLFQGIEMCVMNSGFTSEYFSPLNGVRQGCCVSPLLFVLTVELMAIMIRTNKDIQGGLVHNLECKITQFADDTTCFARSGGSLAAILETLNLFSRYSGLHINYEKLSIVPLGHMTHWASPPGDLAM